LRELRIFDARRRELLARLAVARGDFRLERAANRLVGDRHLGDLAVPQQRLELGVRNLTAAGRQVVHLRDAEQNQEGEAVPEGRRLPRRQRPLTAAVATARVEPWIRRTL